MINPTRISEQKVGSRALRPGPAERQHEPLQRLSKPGVRRDTDYKPIDAAC